MVAGNMVAGNISMMVPAGMAIAMGGRAIPAWNGSMMAGLRMERVRTASRVLTLSSGASEETDDANADEAHADA